MLTIILLSCVVRPVLFLHTLYYHISVQFYSTLLFSPDRNNNWDHPGHFSVIELVRCPWQQQRVEKSRAMIRQLSLAERFWIDDGPLRKEKWFTFPVFIITTLPAFNEPVARQRIYPQRPPPKPEHRPLWDQSFLHMLIIMRFQLKHYLIPVIMDPYVEEVFLSGVDALHAQRAYGRFTKVPFNCRIFQGHTKKGLSSKAWQANSPLLICTRRRRICYEAARCEILITARMDCVLVLSVDPAMWRCDGILWGWDLKIHLGLGRTSWKINILSSSSDVFQSPITNADGWLGLVASGIFSQPL